MTLLTYGSSSVKFGSRLSVTGALMAMPRSPSNAAWPRKKQESRQRREIEITVRPSALVILQPGRAEQELA